MGKCKSNVEIETRTPKKEKEATEATRELTTEARATMGEAPTKQSISISINNESIELGKRFNHKISNEQFKDGEICIYETKREMAYGIVQCRLTIKDGIVASIQMEDTRITELSINNTQVTVDKLLETYSHEEYTYCTNTDFTTNNMGSIKMNTNEATTICRQAKCQGCNTKCPFYTLQLHRISIEDGVAIELIKDHRGKLGLYKVSLINEQENEIYQSRSMETA